MPRRLTPNILSARSYEVALKQGTPPERFIYTPEDALDVLRWTGSYHEPIEARRPIRSNEDITLPSARAAMRSDLEKLQQRRPLELGPSVEPLGYERYWHEVDVIAQRLRGQPELVIGTVSSHPFVHEHYERMVDVLTHSAHPDALIHEYELGILTARGADRFADWMGGERELAIDGFVEPAAATAMMHDVLDRMGEELPRQRPADPYAANPFGLEEVRPGDHVELYDGRRGMVARVFPHRQQLWIVTDDEPPWMMPIHWEDVDRTLRPVRSERSELTPNHDFSFEAYWNAVEDARRRIYPGVNADAVATQAAFDFIRGEHTRAVDVMRWSQAPSWTAANRYPTAADALLAWGNVTMLADIIGPGLPGFPGIRGDPTRSRAGAAAVPRPSLLTDEQYWAGVEQMSLYAIRRGRAAGHEWLYANVATHPFLSNFFRVLDVLEHTGSLEHWSELGGDWRETSLRNDAERMIRGTVVDTIMMDRALKALAAAAFAGDVEHKLFSLTAGAPREAP